jgi:endonuclease/exonuclease/phosphatase family metal-dependent hydrolase
VVAFNAKGGTRFEAILACLKRPPLCEASVILLCEADAGLRRSKQRKVAFDLASRLGMSCAYVGEYGLAEAHGGEPRSYVGNAILCVTPLREVSAIAMPDPNGYRRALRGRLRRFRRVGGPAALVATAVFAGRAIRVCVAHLDSRCGPAGRARQMAALLGRLSAAGPAVLGGDFNTTTTELSGPAAAVRVAARMLLDSHSFRFPESREQLFGHLAAQGFTVDGANARGRPTFTFTRLIPPFFRPKLDWIALRGLRSVPGSAAVIAPRRSFISPRGSDHDFIAVDIEI